MNKSQLWMTKLSRLYLGALKDNLLKIVGTVAFHLTALIFLRLLDISRLLLVPALWVGSQLILHHIQPLVNTLAK